MNKIFIILTAIFVGSGILDIWSSFAIAIFIYYLVVFFSKLNEIIAFREFILVLFAMNFLFAPAVLMNLSDSAEATFYKVKLSKEAFFEITIPTILLLHLGLFSLKTNIFNLNFTLVKLDLLSNERILKRWVIIGIACGLLLTQISTEIAFILYLISMLKFVGAFGLFSINKTSNKMYIGAVFFFEITTSLSRGMFGECILWLIFFVMFWFYLRKPPVYVRTALIVFSFLGFIVFQNSKNDYRSKVWTGGEEGGVESFLNSTQSKRDNVFDLSSITTSLNRVNQGWILASVVDKMNYTNDFQQFYIINQYLEAALLPRFLSPNKLTAGNKDLFNQFSGHRIEEGTSMGLGFFADGYIAFGYWGALAAGFILGFIFSLIFKLTERWIKISPFFMFFIFPILDYAVRPDCETQTIMGHIVKSILLYGTIIYYTKKVMKKYVMSLKVQDDIEDEDLTVSQLQPSFAKA